MGFKKFVLGESKAVNRPSERKTFTTGASGISRLPLKPGTDDGDLIKAYRENQLVRSCVSILADSASDPRLTVQNRNQDEQWEEIYGHPFRQLLIMPNPEMDEAAFFGFAQRSIEVVGVFYAEIIRSAALPVELWPLQPANVTPKYRTLRDGSKELMYYEWKDGSYSKNINPEDMLVRDDQELGGRLSPLASAIRNVDSDVAQTDYIRSFFNNAGVPSGILKYKNREIDQEESDRIRTQWRMKYGRQYGNQNDLVVLDSEAEYQRIGAQLNELDSESLRGFDESRIAMAFGVPPLIVYAQLGLLKATYSNLKEAWEHFWLTTMSAKLKLWRSFFTVNLLGEFENMDDIKAEQSRLFWDMSQVGALQENLDAVVTRSREIWEAGGSTLNEFRSAVNYPEYDDPEMGEMNYFQLQAGTAAAALEAQLAQRTNGTAEEEAEPMDEETETASRGAERAFNRWEWEVQDNKARIMKAMRNRTIESMRGRAQELGIEFTFDYLPAIGAMPHKISETEEEALDAYAAEIYDLANRARNGDLEKDDFITELRETAETNLIAFFLLGSLLDDGQLTETEFEAMGIYIERAKDSASGFADDLYGGRYGGIYAEEDEEGASLANRVALWSGAAGAVLVVGRTFREDDPVLTWRRGPTIEPCDDCLAFEGFSMRASQWRDLWDQDRLPQGFGLECRGFHCLCDLIE